LPPFYKGQQGHSIDNTEKFLYFFFTSSSSSSPPFHPSSSSFFFGLVLVRASFFPGISFEEIKKKRTKERKNVGKKNTSQNNDRKKT